MCTIVANLVQLSEQFEKDSSFQVILIQILNIGCYIFSNSPGSFWRIIAFEIDPKLMKWDILNLKVRSFLIKVSKIEE